MIEAAGGIVLRRGEDGADVLVVHRPKYGDWSLPKGKLEPGESFETAAIREVAEETGWECTLGDELPAVRYTDRNGRDKIVRYWMMTPVAFAGFSPNDEISEVRWLPLGEAATLLSYDADRQLVQRVEEGA